MASREDDFNLIYYQACLLAELCNLSGRDLAQDISVFVQYSVIYVHMCYILFLNIYIYIDRERERE